METFADDGFLKAAPLKRRKTMALSSLLLVAGMDRTWGKNQTKSCVLRRTPLARDISQRMWTNYQGEVEVAPLKIVMCSILQGDSPCEGPEGDDKVQEGWRHGGQC